MGFSPGEGQVRAALEELLSWPAVVRSPQLAKFLSYIVEAKLSGGEASIKAYSIAVDVFGRPATFDPQSDPIVRVQARRLRALLDQFYDEGHAQSGLRIRLPVGRYVPEFAPIDTSGAESEPAEPDRVPQVPAPEEIAPLAAATLVLGSVRAVNMLTH